MRKSDVPQNLLEAVDDSRRAFLKKLILGSAFVVPAVSSFSMSGLGVDEASAFGSNVTVGVPPPIFPLAIGACRSPSLRPGDFSNCDFAGQNFSGQDLNSLVFDGANFANADLSNSNLSNCVLTGANFTNANLTGANLTGANLTGANLSGANMTGTVIENVNLNRAKLKGAIGINEPGGD